MIKYHIKYNVICVYKQHCIQYNILYKIYILNISFDLIVIYADTKTIVLLFSLLFFLVP